MAALRLQGLVAYLSTGVGQEPHVHWRVRVLAAEAEVGGGELGHGELEAALGAGPEELLAREEVGGEEGQLPLPVPRPLLDALEVEQAVALAAAPYSVCSLDTGEAY
jgi:hypothetical protein